MKIARRIATAFLAGAVLLVLLVLLGHTPSASAVDPTTWTREFPTGDPPSPRLDHTAVYDPGTNIMTIFAGKTFSPSLPFLLPQACATCTATPLNDVWVLSNVNVSGTPAWTQLSPTGGPPGPRFGHTAVTTTSGGASSTVMTIYGGQTFTPDLFGLCETCDATSLDEVWTLSDANNFAGTPAWTQLSPDTSSGSPGARTEHSAVYDETNNIMIIFGGKTFDANNCVTCTATPLNDVWTLSNADGSGTPAWTQLSPTGGPPGPRFGHTAVYDSTNNIMIIYGGETFTSGECEACTATPLNDVWVLSNANGSGTPAWTQLSPTDDPLVFGSPSPRSEHTAVYDAGNNIMTIFAGKTFDAGDCAACTATPLGDVWTLSNANGSGTPAWTRIFAARDPIFGRPDERFGHTAVYDQTSNIMTIFSGETFIPGICTLCTAVPLLDVWALSKANGIASLGPLTPKAGIRLASLAPGDPFEVKRSFISGTRSNEIDLLTEDVRFQVGTFPTTTLSGLGSFKGNKKGRFKCGGGS
jgi:hypothetical protein